jgi:hypothetical protein
MRRTLLIALLGSAVGVGAAGCGAAHGGAPHGHTTAAGHPPASAGNPPASAGHPPASAGHPPASAGHPPASAGNPPAFAWLRPAPPPAGWPLARLRGAAVLAYPPGFTRIKSDPGAASAARVDRRSGLITDYLNATPQQGAETLANWASFRPAHNRDEGDSDEQVLAWARGLRFRDGRGSCVIDRYATSRTSYEEIACLIRAPAGQMVIVAAAQTARWADSAPALERAVSAFEA